MKIAVMSDSHDHIPNLRAAVKFCAAYGVSAIIHCGDLISPFMLNELAAFGGAVHLVYGNNAGDQHIISQSCGVRFPAITMHGHYGAMEAGGRRIAIHHYPEMARALASQGVFDVVCCGHNHLYRTEIINNTLIINPGELLGSNGQPGFYILDCASLTVERIEVGLPLFPEDYRN